MNHDEAKDLLGRLLHRIAPDADIAGADEDALLQDELELDSMDFLNLMTALHDETGIDVPEHDYPKVATIAGFADYVSERAVASS